MFIVMLRRGHFKCEVICNISSHADLLRGENISPDLIPTLQDSTLSAVQLIFQDIRSYCAYLDSFFSIHNLRTRRAL